MHSMLTAFALALAQLSDARVLRILIKSLMVTLLVFAGLGAATIGALHRLFSYLRVDFGGPFADVLIIIACGWLLWRIIALAVMQCFADEVVEAVEERHYPAALASAQGLGWREQVAQGLGGAARALIAHLIALPLAVVLLVTGIGPAVLFWAVNAVLLGRELQDMVWLRHRSSTAQLKRNQRFMMGGIVAAMLIIPFLNLLAPVIGAAMATHLVHRSKGPLHAA